MYIYMCVCVCLCVCVCNCSRMRSAPRMNKIGFLIDSLVRTFPKSVTTSR